MSAEISYQGQELDLFAHAANWKRYWSAAIGRYLQGSVLEVGSGLGVNTRVLRSPRQQRWVCLEPDPKLLDQFRASIDATPLAATCELRQGTIASLEPGPQFDAVLYIDVLEHIEDDAAEIHRAAALLKPQGRLVVLAPAHQSLFSLFDASIGHYRRYNRKTLTAAGSSCRALRLERVIYLDSCGLLASFGNKFLLKQNLPTLKQILFWDRVLVPTSRVADPLLFYRIGKSILAVWIKDNAS